MVKQVDYQLIFATAIITLFGVLVHFSLSPQNINLHLAYVALGTLIALFIFRIDSKLLPHFSFHFYLLTLIGLILTLVLGYSTKGSTRWINLGFFQFQPSEFAKPLVILSTAKLISQFPVNIPKNVIITAIFAMLPMGLIFLQPDLGSAAILGLIIATMVFSAGLRFRHLFIILAISLVFAPTFWTFLKPYQQNRILTFVNPTADPLGKGYNSIQAIIAVGSGQIIGRGLGHGTQSKLKFLPEYQTDFVFAALAEELGLLGSLLLIMTYCWLLFRLLRLAQLANTPFVYFSILGIMAYFASQIIINIGMNVGLLPITGITLPLVSSGGSSIVTSLASLGLALNLGKHTKSTLRIEIT